MALFRSRKMNENHRLMLFPFSRLLLADCTLCCLLRNRGLPFAISIVSPFFVRAFRVLIRPA